RRQERRHQLAARPERRHERKGPAGSHLRGDSMGTVTAPASRVYRTTPADLPFRAGDSPFKTKGNAYNSLKAFHAVHVPGGGEAVADALHADLRAFYLQTFLAGGWYDFLPMQLLEKVAISIVGGDSATFLRELGLHAVNRDMKGVYKLLLHFTSP